MQVNTQYECLRERLLDTLYTVMYIEHRRFYSHISGFIHLYPPAMY